MSDNAREMSGLDLIGRTFLVVGALMGFIGWPFVVTVWLSREVELRSPPTIAPDTAAQSRKRG